jgi:hypothetical protein
VHLITGMHAHVVQAFYRLRHHPFSHSFTHIPINILDETIMLIKAKRAKITAPLSQYGTLVRHMHSYAGRQFNTVFVWDRS